MKTKSKWPRRRMWIGVALLVGAVGFFVKAILQSKGTDGAVDMLVACVWFNVGIDWAIKGAFDSGVIS